MAQENIPNIPLRRECKKSMVKFSFRRRSKPTVFFDILTCHDLKDKETHLTNGTE